MLIDFPPLCVEMRPAAVDLLPSLNQAELTWTHGGVEPGGMRVDPQTGAAHWTPPSELRGSIVAVRIGAFNGGCGAVGEQAFNLAISETPPPGGFKLRVGKVELSAGSLLRLNPGAGGLQSSAPRMIALRQEIEDGVYQLGGDMKINDFVRFDGSVKVALNRAVAGMDIQIERARLLLDDDGRNVPVHRYASQSITLIDPLAPGTPAPASVEPGAIAV